MSSSKKQNESENYLAKMVREQNQRWRDSGHTVTEVDSSDTGVYTATFAPRRPNVKKKPQKIEYLRATISVEWGYEMHSITLTARNWRRIISGKPLGIRGKGYHCDGEFFWDRWGFGGGIDGELHVSYGNDGGDGFIGNLKDAQIEEHK
jgi:hypothetical protein